MSEFLQTFEATVGNVVRLEPHPRPVIADADHPERATLERFVAMRFAAAYDARISIDYPLIAGLVAADGRVLAAVGVRFADSEPLFLERYLDTSVEAVLEKAFDHSAPRSSIVEIGAFASLDPVWTLELFNALPEWLAGVCGRRYAVATLRPDLAKSLTRTGFALQPIALADPGRLGPAAEAWGRYYAKAPQVFAGRIGPGCGLSAISERLRARGMQRVARRLARAAR